MGKIDDLARRVDRHNQMIVRACHLKQYVAVIENDIGQASLAVADTRAYDRIFLLGRP